MPILYTQFQTPLLPVVVRITSLCHKKNPVTQVRENGVTASTTISFGYKSVRELTERTVTYDERRSQNVPNYFRVQYILSLF